MTGGRGMLIAAAGLSLALGAPAGAQSLAGRLAAAPEGAVRFEYPARPGACGEGDDIIVRDPGDGEKGGFRVGRGRWGGGEGCRAGPVRVELLSRGGRVEALRLRVGDGFPGAARDLGEVAPQEAADYLLDLAARLPADEGGEAVLAAVLGRGVSVHPRLLELAASDAVPTDTRRDAVFWASREGASLAELRGLYARVPGRVKEHLLFAYSQREEPEAAGEMLRVARDEGEPREVRRMAVFWLGQAAGRAATRDLGEIVEDGGMDLEVREHAVFALSQRPADEAVPALIRIAREAPEPRLRKKAIFWLGQTGDPRALSLFAELLRIR